MATLLKGRKNEPVPAVPRVDETSVAKFFEEVKVLVADLPDRVASQINDSRSRRFRSRRRFHPMMFEEMLHHPALRESPEHAGLPVLMAFSTLRDDFPWLYELGIQLYRAIQTGNIKTIEKSRRAIIETIEMSHRGPLMHDMGPEDDEAMMMLHHFVRSLDRFIQVPGRRTKAGAKENKEP